mmetsp:Transcript_18595/g.25684  ORF Transcript_18595/g.25684 Transcript_18595/m.25684 type:complete len:532 (+) Transcript_18595:25-1620(+)
MNIYVLLLCVSLLLDNLAIHKVFCGEVLELQEVEVDNYGDATIDGSSRNDVYEEDNYEDESSLETSILDKSQSDTSSVLVTFANRFNYPITLYWQGDSTSNEKFKIGDIEPNSEINVDTFIGHNFYATKLGSDEKVQTSKKITKSTSEYSFEPLEKMVTKNPFVTILNVRTTAMSAKFRCFVPSKVHIWYDNGQDGSFQGFLTLGKEYTINTYEGHVFYFTEGDDKTKEYARFVMNKDQVTYLVMDPERPPPNSYLVQQAKEDAFMAEYLNRTGIRWRHYFGPDGPRPPPSLHMWPANNIGEVHKVVSHEGKWICNGTSEECQSKDPVPINLEVVSLQPRVFIIPNFLSDFEVEEIKRLAEPGMVLSQVGDVAAGAFESGTRTSRNAWLQRETNQVTDTLFRRAADLLQVDEALLHRNRNAEDMQVVHYTHGQKYDSHHDWGVSGYPESRFITLLFYLTQMPSPNAGGETSFPKGANGRGFKVQPGKGSAVLFYNLLEDGNGDDLALHAALPVNEGEKWLANFWVWDPKRK